MQKCSYLKLSPLKIGFDPELVANFSDLGLRFDLLAVQATRVTSQRWQLQNRSLTELAARIIEPWLRRRCSMPALLQYAGTCKDDVKLNPQQP